MRRKLILLWLAGGSLAWCVPISAGDERWSEARREASLAVARQQLRLGQALGQRDWLRVTNELAALQTAGARLCYFAQASNEALQLRVPFIAPPSGTVLVPEPNPWAADHGSVSRPVAPHNGYTPRFVPWPRPSSPVAAPPPGPPPVYPWRTNGP